jgi:hypothetical protein
MIADKNIQTFLAETRSVIVRPVQAQIVRFLTAQAATRHYRANV